MAELPAIEDLFRAARERVMGDSSKDHLFDIVIELRKLTKDKDPKTIVVRGMATYRSIVKHVAKGGTVRFVEPDGETFKTLKVRLDPSEGVEEADV